MIEITDVELDELPSKHYYTDIYATVNGQSFCIQIQGSGNKPSSRELDQGWEPDWGMNHTESEEHLTLAYLIIEALKTHG